MNINLDNLRIEIDKIDSELIALLEKRMEISKQVGEYKIQNNLEVLNIGRELDVINKITKMVHNKEFVNQASDIYFEIMKTSRSLQFNDNKNSSFGLLGSSLNHSISPTIHNTLFNHYNIHEKYVLFDIKPTQLKCFIENTNKFNIKGLNVTIPYKVEIIPFLDSIHDIAKNIGSVNTIKIVDGKKNGYNTDFYGFEKLLEINNIDVSNKTVVILGSGGSCRTVSYYCSLYNANKVFVVSRNKKNENIISYDELKNIDFDILINTTPVGMFPNVEGVPINKEILKPHHAVVDLIYNPSTTKLLEFAKEIGCVSVVNGELMLYYQGLKAQEIWELSECNEDNINVIKKAINN